MAKEVEKRSGRATRQRQYKPCREKVVQVRMSDEELDMLDDVRGLCSRSGFMRGRALYGKAGTAVVDVPQLDRMMMELNRIGVNVNQIARACNAARARGGPASLSPQPDADGAGERFADFRESVDRLCEEVRGLRRDLQRPVDDIWAALDPFGDFLDVPADEGGGV